MRRGRRSDAEWQPTFGLLASGDVDDLVVRERCTVEGEDEPEVRQVAARRRPATEHRAVGPPVLDIACQSGVVRHVAEQLGVDVALPGHGHVFLPERCVLCRHAGVARIVEHDDRAVGAGVGDRLRDLESERSTSGRQAGRHAGIGRAVRVVVAVARVRDIARRLTDRDLSPTRGRDRRLTAEAVSIHILVPDGASAVIGRRRRGVVAVRGVRHIARRLRDGNLRHARGRDRRLTPEGVSVRVAVPGRARGTAFIGLSVTVVVEVVVARFGAGGHDRRVARNVAVGALPDAGALTDAETERALRSDPGVGAHDRARLVGLTVAVVVEVVIANLGAGGTGDRTAARRRGVRGAEPLTDLSAGTDASRAARPFAGVGALDAGVASFVDVAIAVVVDAVVAELVRTGIHRGVAVVAVPVVEVTGRRTFDEDGTEAVSIAVDTVIDLAVVVVVDEVADLDDRRRHEAVAVVERAAGEGYDDEH